MYVSPCGLIDSLPIAERLQAKVEHPFGLAFLLGYEPHHILVQTLFYYVGMHVGGEAVFIFLLGHLSHKGIFCIFVFHFTDLLWAVCHTDERAQCALSL